MPKGNVESSDAAVEGARADMKSLGMASRGQDGGQGSRGPEGEERRKGEGATGGKEKASGLEEGGQGKELLLNLVKGLKVVEGKEEGKLQVVRGRSMLEVGGGLNVSEWVSGLEGETEVLEKDAEGLDVSRGLAGRDASMDSGREDDMFSFLG